MIMGLKAVILAGGDEAALHENTSRLPKPMTEIGGRPMLWHVMKTYHHYGVRDFVLCLGRKGERIKEYFLNYAMLNSDVTLRADGKLTVHQNYAENWNITLADTGADTHTGGRLKRVRHHLNIGQPFFMSYADRFADIDIAALLAFHKAHGKMATVTEVLGSDGSMVNGGYFVLDPASLDMVQGDATVWEEAPMERLLSIGQMVPWRHNGFWQAVNTGADREQLERLWNEARAPWKLWEKPVY